MPSWRFPYATRRSFARGETSATRRCHDRSRRDDGVGGYPRSRQHDRPSSDHSALPDLEGSRLGSIPVLSGDVKVRIEQLHVRTDPDVPPDPNHRLARDAGAKTDDGVITDLGDAAPIDHDMAPDRAPFEHDVVAEHERSLRNDVRSRSPHFSRPGPSAFEPRRRHVMRSRPRRMWLAEPWTHRPPTDD